MRANLNQVLIVSTTLFLLVPTQTSSEKDKNSCGRILTRESEIRWSTATQNLIALSEIDEGEEILPSDLNEVADKTGGTQKETHNTDRDRFCILAPDGYHVILHIFLDPDIGEQSTVSNCSSHLSADCKVSCLNIYEPENSITEVVTDNAAVKPSFSTSKTLRPTQSYNTINKTGENSTKTGEHTDRFPRNSVILVNRNQESKKNNFSAKMSRKRKRTHKCKKCKKKSRRKQRSRAHKRKLELFQLLLQYHELLMERDVATLPKNAGVNHNMSNSSKQGAGTQKSEALKEVFQKINSFVEPEKRKISRENMQTKPFAMREGLRRNRPPKMVEIRTPPTLPPIGDANMGRGRQKRQILNDNSTQKITNPGGSSDANQPRFTLCGLEERWNASTGENGFSLTENQQENATLFQVSRGQRSSDSENPTWISLEKPVLVKTNGPTMELNVINALNAEDNLLQFLVLKVSFVLNDQELEEVPEMTENDQQISTTSIRFTSKSPSTEKEQIGTTTNTSKIGPRTEKHDPNANTDDIIKIAAGIVGGVVGVVLLTGACLYLMNRKRRQRSSFSGKLPKEGLIDVAESEKCLSTSESASDRPQYKIMKKKGAVVEESQSDMTEESEFMMLEHEKPANIQLQRNNSSRKQHCRTEEMTKSHGNKHNHHRPQHHNHNHMQTKCKHPNGARGSSRHEHCIVCQIAENPHQPIMTAQYASEFLPPASRPNAIGGGCGTTLHNNFDKFNRMQNNPYRYSPSLPVRHSTLPSTVHLPDGEDLHKNRTEQKSQHHTLDGASLRDTSFMKPPPNRTIFESQALPFGSSTNLHRKIRKVNNNGYPGPPSSGSKHDRLGSKHHHHGDSRVNLISCLSDGDLKYSSHRLGSHEKDKCICKYILEHIDEPPPEYSDVIREGEHAPCTTSQVDNLNNNVVSPDCNSEATKVFLEDRDMSTNHDDNDNNDGNVQI